MSTAALIQLDPAAAYPTTVPDADRPHPAGLTWVMPLEPRPIVLGPSANRPVPVPALSMEGGRFWSGAHHGTDIGHARLDLDAAAREYALQPAPTTGALPVLAVALTQAAAVLDGAITDYARELAS